MSASLGSPSQSHSSPPAPHLSCQLLQWHCRLWPTLCRRNLPVPCLQSPLAPLASKLSVCPHMQNPEMPRMRNKPWVILKQFAQLFGGHLLTKKERRWRREGRREAEGGKGEEERDMHMNNSKASLQDVYWAWEKKSKSDTTNPVW